jgi:hypothetical protein
VAQGVGPEFKPQYSKKKKKEKKERKKTDMGMVLSDKADFRAQTIITSDTGSLFTTWKGCCGVG